MTNKERKALEEIEIYNESSLKWWQILLFILAMIGAMLAGWFL